MTKTFLCLDYGTKRIGTAIATTPLAEPLTIIPNDHRTLTAIKHLCDHHHVTDLVIGISEGIMAEKSQAFAKEIEVTIDLPIHLQNETLSSFEVHDQLLSANAKKSKTRQPIDHFAAATILQDFLDETKPY